MDQHDSHAERALEVVARIGYAAKGLIYVAIGVLAAMAAAGTGGKTTDTQGAIRELASQPFGQIILVVLCVGLVGHVVWRLVQAWADPDHKGTNAKGFVTRLGFVISALVYAALAVYTFDLLVGAFGSSGGGSSTEDRTAKVMSMPGGLWLVGLTGVVFLGVAAYHVMRAYKRNFLKHWDTQSMQAKPSKLACRIASTGLFARAIVFFTIGVLLIIAAYRANPDEAEGLGGALQTLAQQPFGPFLLGAVAVGLVCYGFYCFVNSRYRHINP